MAPDYTRDTIYKHNKAKPSKHDDVIKWKHIPRYRPFARAIYWSPVNSPHKGRRRRVWCCRPGDKPLSEPMMVRLLTHICVIRPHWVNVCDTCSIHGVVRSIYSLTLLIMDRNRNSATICSEQTFGAPVNWVYCLSLKIVGFIPALGTIKTSVHIFSYTPAQLSWEIHSCLYSIYVFSYVCVRMYMFAFWKNLCLCIYIYVHTPFEMESGDIWVLMPSYSHEYAV